jgi:hypothetical protein
MSSQPMARLIFAGEVLSLEIAGQDGPVARLVRRAMKAAILASPPDRVEGPYVQRVMDPPAVYSSVRGCTEQGRRAAAKVLRDAGYLVMR